MNLARRWKSWWYPLLPSVSFRAHEKRRKGLFYRGCPPEVLECQQEQDRLFWSHFLRPRKGGNFLELGGDGVTGSHTLGLELMQSWTGTVMVRGEKPAERARKTRRCRVIGVDGEVPTASPVDLLAWHRPAEFPTGWARFCGGPWRPGWVIVENRAPDPRWCRLLEGSGYRLRFFFHDDEYYGRKD